MGKAFNDAIKQQIADKARFKKFKQQQELREAHDRLLERQESDRAHFLQELEVKKKQKNLLKNRLATQEMQKLTKKKIESELRMAEAEAIREKLRRDQERVFEMEKDRKLKQKKFLRGLSSQIDRKLERRRLERRLEKEMELRNPGLETRGDYIDFFDVDACRDWCKRLKMMEKQRLVESDRI